MTLDQQRKAGLVELAASVAGFAVLWHVGGSVTNVAECDDFTKILVRAREWARSEGIPWVRVLH
jgi:hypothetical protein